MPHLSFVLDLKVTVLVLQKNGLVSESNDYGVTEHNMVLESNGGVGVGGDAEHAILDLLHVK
jgi:hypothetical protein